jgi:hypothetical protein
LQSSCYGADHLFSPLSKGAGVFALWWGHRDSPTVMVGSAGFLHCGRQTSYQLQSSRLPLSGGFGITALVQERWDSPARRWGLSSCQAQWGAWASVHLGRQVFWCYLLSSKLQLSYPQWGICHFWSLTEKHQHSCAQAQWEAQGLLVP